MESLGDYTEWHRLLDELCNRHGFYGNDDLASEFCARSRRNRQADFDAARRKLRSWRTGQRVPRHGNFATLSTMLEVDRHPGLKARWDALYRAASAKTRGTIRDDVVQPVPNPVSLDKQRLPLPRWLAIGALPLMGIGLAATAIGYDRIEPGNLPEVGYNAFVRVRLGTSQLIHGEYDSCESPPPDWAQVEPKVPSTRLGLFTDGGLARKMVNDCGKEMVVRAVMFTAVESGVEELRLLDDYMKIEVHDQP